VYHKGDTQTGVIINSGTVCVLINSNYYLNAQALWNNIAINSTTNSTNVTNTTIITNTTNTTNTTNITNTTNSNGTNQTNCTDKKNCNDGVGGVGIGIMGILVMIGLGLLV